MQIISFSKNLVLTWKTLYNKELTLNQFLNEFIPAYFLCDFSNYIKRCLKTEPLVFERIITFPTGKTYNLQFNLNPINPSNDITYILICIQNNPVCIQNNPNKKNIKALTRYANSASHKLRGPIRNIQMISHKLDESNEFDFYSGLLKKLLEDIKLQAELLDSIIASLKALLNENNYNSMTGQLSVKKINSIVLLDDDPLFNMVHHRLIACHQSSIEIHSFSEPMCALAFIQSNPPDLITLDINMPVINGWQFLQLLEAKEINIDVVIISSSVDNYEKTKALTFKNVKHFLAKPITKEDIKLILG